MEAMIVSYGEGVLKSSVGKIGSFLLNEALLIGSVREDIQFIMDELQSMDAVVWDLIHAGPLSYQDKVWMLHVLQVACDAELCIDEFTDYLGGHCGRGVFGAARRAARFVSTVAPRYRIAHTIQDLKARAAEVSQRRSRYAIAIQPKVPADTIELRRRAAKVEPHGMRYIHLIQEDTLVGVASSFEQLQQKMAPGSFKVIAIVGPPGSGKTALAKMVYRRRNDPRQEIKTSAWVTLSMKPEKIDKQRVLGDILRQVDPCHGEMENYTENELIDDLKSKLAHRFLLILDALRRKEDWDEIKDAIPVNLNGVVVLTARDKNVVSHCCPEGDIIELKFTSEDTNELCANLLVDHTIRRLGSCYEWVVVILKCFWFVLKLFLDLLAWVWDIVQVRRSKSAKVTPFQILAKYNPNDKKSITNAIKVIIASLYFVFLCWIILAPLKLFLLINDSISGQTREKAMSFLNRVIGVPLKKTETYFRLIRLRMRWSSPEPLEVKFICGTIADKSMDYQKANDLFEELGKQARQEKSTRPMKVIRCCYEIISPSLKKCADDLNILPECYAVSTRRLTRRWAALDLVSPAQGLSKEEVAESNFEELVARGFIEAESMNSCGKVKSCRINSVFKESVETELNTQNSIQLYDTKSSDALNCFRKKLSSKDPESLIVLDLEGFKGLKKNDLDLLCSLFVKIKFLSLRNTDVSEIPKKIRKLRHLETLDIRQTKIKVVPESILDLHGLKHLYAGCINKPESGTGDLELSTDAIEVPSGIEEMSNIQTLTYVKATKASNLLLYVRQMTQLRKLGLVIDRNTVLNSKPLCISLMMLSSSLVSLSVFDERDSGSLEFLEYLCFPPLRLNSLTLRGYLGRLPQWISDHKCLTKLVIAETRLSDDGIRLIGKISTLLCLKLYNNSFVERGLTLENKEFPVLRALTIHCDTIEEVCFKKGTAPKLEVFRWVVTTAVAKELVGIDNLPMLKEVSLIGDVHPDQQNTVRDAVEKHPNHKTVLVFEKIEKTP